MADITLDQAIPVVQNLAERKANAFVRRCGLAVDEREDVESRLVLTFITRWPKFDSQRASVRTFASRVMDAEIDVHIAGGGSRFPYGTTFVGADIATDELVRERHAEGRAVVIVDEHGNERFLPVP